MSVFDLTEVYTIFARDPAELIEDIDYNDAAFEGLLDDLIDTLAVRPEAIVDEDNFKTLYYLINSFNSLSDENLDRLLDLLISGFSKQTQEVQAALQSGETVVFQELKVPLEQYGFLLHYYLIQLESHKLKEFLTKKAVGASAGRRKATAASKDPGELTTQILDTLTAVIDCLKLNLDGILATSTERDTFCALFLRPVYLFMESEYLIKQNAVRMHLFKVICLAVKMQHQQTAVETSLMQLITYFEHLPEPIVELLQILYEQYDHRNISVSIINELSSKQFNNNDTKGPKVVSTFFTTASIYIPEILLKQMSTVVNLLESESNTLRAGIIESVGNVLLHEAEQEEEVEGASERYKSQVHALLELIQERCLDISPHSRCRALDVLTQVCALEIKFTKQRPQITRIAVNSMQDKSYLVRKHAMKLVDKLISTHPFGLLHGSRLNLSEWKDRLKAINQEIDKIAPEDKRDRDSMAFTPPNPDELKDLDGKDSDEGEEDHEQPENKDEAEEQEEQNGEGEGEDQDDESSPPSSMDDLATKFQLTKKYYVQAIDFIQKMHEALSYAELLLFSKNKNEVIDAMDLFVLADAYDIETARQGIRKMIRLVWAKANNDEGNAIQSHLITCYQSLFFNSPAGLTESEANLVISRNIISLTYGASLAELTSLEHMLVLAVEREKLVSKGLIKTLWKIYGYPQDISKSQRRGAIILLGMIASADHTVASSGMELLLKIGLGERGQEDLGLAKYTCTALQRCISKDEWKKLPDANTEGSSGRLPVNHEAIHKLASFLLIHHPSMEWFGVAEQAVKAINDLCETPSLVFSEVIKEKTRQVFAPSSDEEVSADKQIGLSQLLFIVGEISLATMVYLERCEALFKRAKIAAEGTAAKSKEEKKNKKKKGKKNGEADAADVEAEEDDIEMVGGGTTEDDFTEAIEFIRERELLYSEKSLLTRFGPLVSELCKSILKTKHIEAINVAATLCLSKFMCVSAQYCEDNIGTLLKLSEQSDSSTIRSNSVLALGDIAVCFNHILDDNTEALYQRLHDKDSVVQRTCLMTLTFLILAGQVKVKGQLGEMAKCLESTDKAISDLAKMFFSELATKDNAIYNGFIDMFSMLSADKELHGDSLHKIFKFITGFIEKDKQIRQLSDKLYHRLEKCTTEKDWNDISFVLGILPHKNEDISNLLNKGFQYALKVE